MNKEENKEALFSSMELLTKGDMCGLVAECCNQLDVRLEEELAYASNDEDSGPISKRRADSIRQCLAIVRALHSAAMTTPLDNSDDFNNFRKALSDSSEIMDAKVGF